MNRHKASSTMLLVLFGALIGIPSTALAAQHHNPQGATLVVHKRKTGRTAQSQLAPEPARPAIERPTSLAPRVLGNPPGGGAPQPPLTETVLSRKLGSDRLHQVLGDIANTNVGGCTGRSSSCASVWYDGARLRTNDDVTLGPQSRLFEGGASPTTLTHNEQRATVAEGKEASKEFGGIPGGVVLDGVAVGLGEIDSVRYDSRFNAFILDDRAVYFMRVPPKSVAILCRAIARDTLERVGVSLGKVQQVYGKVPPNSDLAWDLKLADLFLGSIIFAWDVTEGYRFANNFTPQAETALSYDVAVFFKFNQFGFQIQDQQARLARANLDVRLFPLAKSTSPDGALQPDSSALAQGLMSERFERTAKHVADNIDYYRHERIVDRMFAYGEVAAFIRELKRSGFDLESLAAEIAGETEEP